MLRDMPLIAGDDSGTGLLVSTHHLAQFFRVKSLRERGGVYQVTEQHRELAPLGFGYAPRSSTRSAGRGRSGLFVALLRRGSGRLSREWPATLAAELGGWSYLVSTAWANLYELRPALLTELRPFEILKPTAWALHTASLF